MQDGRVVCTPRRDRPDACLKRAGYKMNGANPQAEILRQFGALYDLFEISVPLDFQPRLHNRGAAGFNCESMRSADITPESARTDEQHTRFETYVPLIDAWTTPSHSSNDGAGQLLSTRRELALYGRGVPPNQLNQPWPGIHTRGTSNSLITN